MNIKTVLFDLDGTIADTNELITASFKHTFDQYGYEFSEEEIREMNGPPLTQTFTRINPDQAEEMIKTYRRHNFEFHDQFVKEIPYAKETIEHLLDRGITIGVVTAKMREGAEKTLAQTKLAPYFDVVVTIDDVIHPKPHPESVQLAMEKLQANPPSTIMIGDNYHDIEAGKKALTQTAGVAWSKKGRVFLQQYNPTYMLEDMRDLLKIVGV